MRGEGRKECHDPSKRDRDISRIPISVLGSDLGGGDLIGRKANEKGTGKNAVTGLMSKKEEEGGREGGVSSSISRGEMAIVAGRTRALLGLGEGGERKRSGGKSVTRKKKNEYEKEGEERGGRREGARSEGLSRSRADLAITNK